MRTKLYIENNSLYFINQSKYYTFELNDQITLEKRANDYIFYGNIEVSDYDHRNNIHSNKHTEAQLIIQRSYLTDDIIHTLNHSDIQLKKDPVIKNLSILYIPLFILIILFIIINLIV